MQDRFKFRVWDKSTQEMYDDLTNYPGDMEVTSINQTFREYLDNENNIVMQCTGLKDKNGKLIYEGDIVKPSSKFVLDYRGEIKFGKKENYQCFYVDWHTKYPIMRGDLYYWLEDEEEGLEVIGNIYGGERK